MARVIANLFIKYIYCYYYNIYVYYVNSLFIFIGHSVSEALFNEGYSELASWFCIMLVIKPQE